MDREAPARMRIGKDIDSRPAGDASAWWRIAGILGLAVAVVAGAYIFASSQAYKAGFPLDDAWIHQTYARNLALRGEWAFVPGQPSAGSTAPLWSVLLAVGYWLRAPYLAWTYFLGALSLLGLALAGEALFRDYLPGRSGLVPLAGLFLAGEWHLAWASVSGMETLLEGLLILVTLYSAGRARGRSWWWTGLMVGLSAWVRPDGVTLLGPAVMVLVLAEPSMRARLRGLGGLAVGVALLFIPYLLFNLAIQGSVWPNTFYAKQAEYAVLRDIPILTRLINELRLPLIGSGLFLLPGFAWFSWEAWRERRWAALAAIAWFLGYALLYALRLPATYQYGRYFMPAMPVFFVTGLAGTVRLLSYFRKGRVRWLLARVWVASGAAIWLAFLMIGSGRYAQDVAIIETEMVDSARWVAANTSPGALVAAHDIGALGYFGQRPILDLAGLVSPQVIPFIRDEDRIAQWLDEEGASYLVVFSGWYTRLPSGKTELYQSTGRYSEASGGGVTRIYRWAP